MRSGVVVVRIGPVAGVLLASTPLIYILNAVPLYVPTTCVQVLRASGANALT